MKLAFCLFNYFPFGGLQRDFLRIARECQNRGHSIHVYTMRWEGKTEPGFHLHIIQVDGWQNHTRCRQFVNKVTPLLQKEQYDIVIGFNKMPHLDIYYAADVCYQTRIRETRPAFYRLLPRYQQWVALEKAVFAPGNATDILLLSPIQQEAYSAHYHTEKERFHLLPPGISKDRLKPDNADFYRQKIRTEFNIPQNHFLLLMIASSFKTKGLDRVIKGIAALPAEIKKYCHLLVVGQDKPAHFMKLANKLNVGNAIQFSGGRNDVPAFLLAADLLVHPATHENTGNVLLEALAAGLPVLTVDVCGYAHYIKDANAGVVLPSPYNQNNWNETLLAMLTSKKLEVWGNNGFVFASKTDIYSLLDKAVDLILAKKSHSPKIQQTTDGYLDPSLLQYFSPHTPLFSQLMALDGELFRSQKNRFTQRIRLGEQHYFIKQYKGIGWREIIKNLLQFRLPSIDANAEKHAILKLASIGVNVPHIKGAAVKGSNPATRQSFLLMEEITPAVSLEALTATWQNSPPTFAFKKALIEKIASIARRLHTNGINHRDFYLCHFLLTADTPLTLYLIDLHRAQFRQCVPKRWKIKDLSGLYFSSKHCRLTNRDLYRFIKIYSEKSLRDILQSEHAFWKKVKHRGERLYRDHQ